MNQTQGNTEPAANSTALVTRGNEQNSEVVASPAAFNAVEASAAASTLVEAQEAELSRRRQAQHEHHHKQIWTKDPHARYGGYAPAGKGSNVLVQQHEQPPLFWFTPAI
jgi:hypothetical protein